MKSNGHLTQRQAAELLGIGVSTLRRWIAQGRIDSSFTKDKVLELRDHERQLLTTADAARLLGVCDEYICSGVRTGAMRLYRKGKGGQGHRFELEDVIKFWRSGMGGACLRCGILGEARPELGFLCVACEYERRTGRIYRWPTYPEVTMRPALRGRLVEGFGIGG